MIWPELYPDILRQLGAILVAKIGERIAPDELQELVLGITEEVRAQWGGGLIYFPKGDAVYRKKRNDAIVREFNGHNHAELSRKYGLAVATIYELIEADRLDRQQDLFR